MTDPTPPLPTHSATPTLPTAERWRLLLGRFAEPRLGGCPGGCHLDDALAFLYDRGSRGRGVCTGGGGAGGRAGGAGGVAAHPTPGQERGAGTGPSVFTVPEWITRVRELFPQDTVERITAHAVHHYGLTELILDAETLAQRTPDLNLLKQIVAYKGLMQPDALAVARRLVRQIVDELVRTLARDVRPALAGVLSRRARSNLPVAANFDARRTLRENLKTGTPTRSACRSTALTSSAASVATCPGTSS